jgi:hypothetical protein
LDQRSTEWLHNRHPLSHEKTMTTERTLATLKRIAAILDEPPSAFLEPRNPVASAAPPAALQQTTDLLDAFSRITDPETRRECIAFVRARTCTAVA